MSTPMSVAARLLARLLNPVPASLVAAGAVTLAPAIVVEARANDDWQFSGFHGSAMHSFPHHTQYTAPPISRADLRLFAQVLDLDETQQEILADAYAEFLNAYNREWTLHAEARSDAEASPEGSGDWDWVRNRQAELRSEYEAAMDRLEQAFAADLRLLLTAGQLERWSDFERERRRLKTLESYASHPEERLDLVRIVQSLDLDDEAERSLAPLLEEYRVQIDAALVARNAKARSLGEELQQLQDRQEEVRNARDPVGMGEAWAQIREQQKELVPAVLELDELCSRVRDINISFRARIEEGLPAGSVETFRELTMSTDRNPLDGMFRADRMLTWLDRIASSPGTFSRFNMSGVDVAVTPLSEEQTQQIEGIRADFEAGREALYARYLPRGWSKAERYHITLSTPQGQVSLSRRIDHGSQGGVSRIVNGVPISDELQTAVSELDQRTVDQIRRVLTIDQRQMIASY